jgi:hypothetical protein
MVIALTKNEQQSTDVKKIFVAEWLALGMINPDTLTGNVVTFRKWLPIGVVSPKRAGTHTSIRAASTLEILPPILSITLCTNCHSCWSDFYILAYAVQGN